MRTLEDRLTQASDEARSQVDHVDARPASTISRRAHQRRALVGATALIFVFGVFGGTALLVGGEVESRAPGAGGTSPSTTVEVTTTVTVPSDGGIETILSEDPTALIMSHTAVEFLPPVVMCQGDGISKPNVSGVGTDTNAYPSAEDALRAFLVENRTIPGTPGLAQAGYVELSLPDGSISFGKVYEGDDSYVVTLVNVSETDTGWVVGQWEASGC